MSHQCCAIYIYHQPLLIMGGNINQFMGLISIEGMTHLWLGLLTLKYTLKKI